MNTTHNFPKATGKEKAKVVNKKKCGKGKKR